MLVYNKAKEMLLNGQLNLLNDTIKVMLVDSSYTPNPDDDYVGTSGAATAEVSGTGYVGGHGGAGRKVLTNKVVVEDDTNDRAYFDADDVTWTSIDVGSIQAAILIKEGAVDDSTSLLIAYIDQGGFPVTTNGGDLTIQWDAGGILHLS